MYRKFQMNNQQEDSGTALQQVYLWQHNYKDEPVGNTGMRATCTIKHQANKIKSRYDNINVSYICQMYIM